MKRIKVVLLALVALMSLPMVAQQLPPLPLDQSVRYGVLPNGLTYYIRHNEEPRNLVNFYIAQKVGAVQEEEDQRGLAHFLEHMAFNGSVNFPADGQLIKYCESIGVKFGQNLNAYTSTDETVYNIDDVPVSESNIDSCLLILHDWSGGLLLTEEEINKERGVIHEEWRMRSSASQRIINRNLETLYPDSRYGKRMPIGLMSVIDNFAPDFLRAYYKKWYRPDLQGVIIVGDIDVDQMEAKVKEIFSPIEMPENPAAYELYPVPDNEAPIYVIDKDKEQSQAIIEVFFKQEALPRAFRESHMLLVQNYVNSIICSSINARLAELSLQPDCPFIGAQVNYDNYIISKTKDAFMLYVIPKPGQDVASLQVAMQEVERARQFGITGTEVFRAKEEYMSRLEKAYTNRNKTKSGSYIQEYVRHFLEGDCAPGIEMEYQIMQQIVPNIPSEMFSEAIKGYSESIENNFVVLAIYPEKEGVTIPSVDDLKGAVAAARAAQLEAYVDEVNDEPLVAKKPKAGKIVKEEATDFGYTKWTLKNGAHVYFKQTDFNDAQVLMTANSVGGTSLISDADIVNGKLMDDVLNVCGWGNFTSTELEKKLAGKQVGLSVNISGMTEGLSGNSTPKDLRTLFELTYLHFQQPKQDEAAYNNYISMMRAQLENADKQPMTSFRDSITSTIYGNLPRVKGVKLADLDKADYATIQRLYNERFLKKGVNDFDFFFTGAIDVDSLRAFTEQYIAALPKVKGARETYINHKLYPREGEHMNRYERGMETPQAYVLQLWSGVNEYSVENDVAVQALSSALDQSLMKSIREEAGFAYSVSVSGGTNYLPREDYNLQIVAPFTPAKCDSVLYLIEEGIQEVAKNGISQKAIDDFKQFELKEYADSQRSNGYWHGLIQNKVIWGHDRRTGVKEAIEAVNSEKVQKFVNDVLLKQHNRSTVIMLPADLTE